MVWAVTSQPIIQARTSSRPDTPSCWPSASEAAVSGLFGWLLNVAMSSFSRAWEAAPLRSVAKAAVVGSPAP